MIHIHVRKHHDGDNDVIEVISLVHFFYVDNHSHSSVTNHAIKVNIYVDRCDRKVTAVYKYREPDRNQKYFNVCNRIDHRNHHHYVNFSVKNHLNHLIRMTKVIGSMNKINTRRQVVLVDRSQLIRKVWKINLNSNTGITYVYIDRAVVTIYKIYDIVGKRIITGTNEIPIYNVNF